MFPTITRRPPPPPPKRYIREDIFARQPEPAAVERYCKAIKTIKCESCGADIKTGGGAVDDQV